MSDELVDLVALRQRAKVLEVTSRDADVVVMLEGWRLEGSTWHIQPCTSARLELAADPKVLRMMAAEMIKYGYELWESVSHYKGRRLRKLRRRYKRGWR